MFATTSPRTPMRRLSDGSFNSNPDMDLNSNEEHNDYTVGGGGGVGLGINVVNVGGNGNGHLRPPTPGLGTPSRPPRDSLVRQSLHAYGAPNPPPAYPPQIGERPRRSFIPPSEYGYHDPPLSRAATRPPTQYRPPQFPPAGPQTPFNGLNYDGQSYVAERMEIERQQDEEIASRPRERGARASRLRRFATTLLRPFRAIKSVITLPRFLRIRWRKRRSTSASPRPITQSSGWDFRDQTPAPTTAELQHSNEGGELGGGVGAGNGNNVTMLFPEAQTLPPAVESVAYEGGGRGPRGSERMDSAHGHSVTHHSHSHPHSYGHASPQAASHRSDHSHLHPRNGEEETIKANANGGAAVPLPDTHSRLHSGTSSPTQSSFSAFSPEATSRVYAGPTKEEESSRGGRRFSHTLSMKSHGSSLLHQFRLIFEAFRALYHLPWVADPPKRVAADFIPAFSARSKYHVQEQQRHQQWRGNGRMGTEGRRGWAYPPEVLIAAAAAKNMEPGEGKSWYRPSPAQVEKIMKRKGLGSTSSTRDHSHGSGSGHYHHRHGRGRYLEQGNYLYNPQSLANAYQTLFPDDSRQRHGQAEGQQVFVVGQPFNATGLGPSPPFPQPFGGATMAPGTFYIVPGPPPPFPTAQMVAPQMNTSASQAPQAGTGATTIGNGNANGNGSRAPPPTARPPSVMSVSFRPSHRPIQNSTSSNQHQPQAPDPNANTTNPNPSNPNPIVNVPRPPPLAAAPTQQQMYMFIQAPPSAPGLAPHPSHHLPPSYTSGGGINIYPYPYTPPWTPPSQRM